MHTPAIYSTGADALAHAHTDFFRDKGDVPTTIPNLTFSKHIQHYGAGTHSIAMAAMVLD